MLGWTLMAWAVSKGFRAAVIDSLGRYWDYRTGRRLSKAEARGYDVFKPVPRRLL